jgi:inositol hexakisphosphate/diphosphoinositol-pentakisphosphate kinase
MRKLRNSVSGSVLNLCRLHNREFMVGVFVDENENPSDPKAPLRDLFHKSKKLFDYVAPREYGITDQEKLEIGVLTSIPLLEKIISCLTAARSQESACTRLFFTKESHVHTLFNVIRLSFSPGITEFFELDYLTQITFELYERNRGLGTDNPLEYSLRIGFSPGAHDPGLIDTQMDVAHALSVAPRK